MNVLQIECKDNANERNESLLSNCRVQLILCKDKKKIWKTNEMRTKIFERKFPVGQFTASNWGKVIFDAFLSRKASLRISNRQVCDGGLPIIPHNSFQMRSGYMNLALLTCVSRTGKIIGTIGSCMDFDACESKNGTIFVHFSLF